MAFKLYKYITNNIISFKFFYCSEHWTFAVCNLMRVKHDVFYSYSISYIKGIKYQLCSVCLFILFVSHTLIASRAC